MYDDVFVLDGKYCLIKSGVDKKKDCNNMCA